MSKGWTKFWSFGVFSVCCLVFGSASLRAQTYEVIIYNPSAGFNETDGLGLGGVQRVGAGRIFGAPLPEDTHALLWVGNSLSPTDLQPSGWNYSRADDTDGTRQVGAVWSPTVPSSYGIFAALWSGTAQSFVPLCSYPYCGNSEAFAIGGDQQVGYTDDSFTCGECGITRIIHAALWRGSPQSYVDLHPNPTNTDDESRAFDTDGVQQVGYKYFAGSSRPYRALLWSGTPQSAVDLSPANFAVTFAYAVKNGVQVGTGQNYDQGTLTMPRSLVWRGTAQSVVDLGFGVPRDTNGAQHVGTAPVGYSNHAFRWDGTTGTGADLHNLLPAGVYVNSGAEEIDEAGNIIGWAQRADTYYLEAVLWHVANSLNSAPTVTLTSLRAKGFYAIKEPINLSVTASDTDGSVVQVEYFANGELIGSSVAGKDELFSMTWQPTDTGSYRVQAQAMDNMGATTMSAPVLIRIR
jgi:hypothetical protein